jgi:hypothetical protein
MSLLRKIIKSWYFPWLVLGIVLRILVAASTAHPDLWALFFAQQLFVFKNVFNIYDYLAYLPETSKLVINYGTNFFTYPPLAYFFFGFLGLISKPFLSLDNFSRLVASYPQIHDFSGLFQTLLLFKLPYLIFDLGIAFLLADFFQNKKKKRLAFLFWIFNPLSFYTSFMVGQFDVIPLFFSVLALNLSLRKKVSLSALSLGVGGALKMFPFLFLPFLILISGKGFWGKIKLAILGVLPYFLTVVPFLASPVFRQVALFSSQSQKMLHMTLPVSGAEGIYIFVFLFTLLAIFAAYNREKVENLWWYFLGVMLLFFSVTHYHPQWFLWLTPFLIWELVENNFKHLSIALMLFFCWLITTLFFEPSLSYGLFNPLWPQLEKAPGISDFISRYTDVFQLKSLIRSIFAGISFFYIVRLFLNRKEE